MELYPFQQEAVKKLWPLKSSLIGDEMGLGKTVQAVQLDSVRRHNYQKLYPKVDPATRQALMTAASKGLKTLVVAPLSVLPAWEDHFKRMTPEGARIITVNSKNRTKFVQAVKTNAAHIYICHWEALRLMPELSQTPWFHVIADEVHRAKNRKALQTQALWKIRTVFKTGLSGTAADNRPDDLWAILHWLYPHTWSSYWKFFNRHVQYKTVERYGRGGNKITVREICGVAFVDELNAQMRPFYVRRLKEFVAKDLPDKYYTTYQVQLTPQQRKAYDQMRENMLAWIGEHEEEALAAPVAIAQLTRLQQFALASAKIEDGRVVLTDPSSKIDLAMDLIKDNEEEQIVVFSQSKQAINLLAKRLEKAKILCGVLTGDTKQADRGKLVENFQAGRYRVFVGTIGAGGVGITLTAASTVIFLDRDWREANNRQAEDRLHRFGQKSAVQVIDIIAHNTVDMGRLQKIELKWSWLKQLLGDGNNFQFRWNTQQNLANSLGRQ